MSLLAFLLAQSQQRLERIDPQRQLPTTNTMTCPPGCTCPESLLAKSTPTKSRYFTGISPAVIFVASLSFLAFFTVVLGAVIVAAINTLLFFVLPLAAAAAGAYVVAAPETIPLGSDPALNLVLRAAGAVTIAYAGGAMIVGRSGCALVKSAHLMLVAGSLSAIVMAFALDDSSAFAEDGVSEKAAVALGSLAALAVTGAVMTAAGPAVSKRLQAGKPREPVMTCMN